MKPKPNYLEQADIAFFGERPTGCLRSPYHREVQPPVLRFTSATRLCAAVVIVTGLTCAAITHLAYQARHAEATRRIDRLEHDVKWCGRRIDRLREEQRPIKFIAVAP